MLEIHVPAKTVWNETKEEFHDIPDTHLCLEHSLVSISKWETIWHKPFISKENKTKEEMFDYIKCMTITQNVDPALFGTLDNATYQSIIDYMNDPATATTFSEINKSAEQQSSLASNKVTSELIYYWMISLQIPFECQKWHLNRLLTLIKVCNINSNHGKNTMSQREILARNQKLNSERRAKLNSKG